MIDILQMAARWPDAMAAQTLRRKNNAAFAALPIHCALGIIADFAPCCLPHNQAV
jgi:hypothetical protein